jgi:hypothetical protein
LVFKHLHLSKTKKGPRVGGPKKMYQRSDEVVIKPATGRERDRCIHRRQLSPASSFYIIDFIDN